jgi:hypothetical protein
MKTEHAGPKNGGGAWTTRADAKTRSRSLRRRAEPHIVAEQVDAMDCCPACADMECEL